jgi:hypothetical protein
MPTITVPPCRHTFDLSRLGERLATCTRCGYVERAALPPRGDPGPMATNVRLSPPKGKKGPSGLRQADAVRTQFFQQDGDAPED